jgi:DNA-binding MarR family transcriptional regulator
MRLEDEIMQKSFKNEYDKLSVNLIFTVNWLSGHHSKIMKAFGISAQQFNVLRILKGQSPNPSSLVMIRERMLDKESNASRLIDKLEKSGLTKRVQCPNDRRQVEITITEKGDRLLEQLNPKVEEISSCMKSINEQEAEVLNKLLDKLRNK